MTKRKKKSIAELLNKPALDEQQMEKAIDRVHKIGKMNQKEATVRATVDIPLSFHKELKKMLIDESLELKTFCLQAILEKYERLTSSPENRLN